MNPESVQVTAGLGGFLAFFVLAIALYLLMRNMNARLRRMAYREETEARNAAQTSAEAASPDAASPDAAQSSPDDSPDPSGRKGGPDLG